MGENCGGGGGRLLECGLTEGSVDDLLCNISIQRLREALGKVVIDSFLDSWLGFGNELCKSPYRCKFWMWDL